MYTYIFDAKILYNSKIIVKVQLTRLSWSESDDFGGNNDKMENDQ